MILLFLLLLFHAVKNNLFNLEYQRLNLANFNNNKHDLKLKIYEWACIDFNYSSTTRDYALLLVTNLHNLFKELAFIFCLRFAIRINVNADYYLNFNIYDKTSFLVFT